MAPCLFNLIKLLVRYLRICKNGKFRIVGRYIKNPPQMKKEGAFKHPIRPDLLLFLKYVYAAEILSNHKARL